MLHQNIYHHKFIGHLMVYKDTKDINVSILTSLRIDNFV